MASCGRVNMAICCCNSPGRRSSGAHKEAQPVGCQFKTPVSALVGRSGGETQYQTCQVKSLTVRGVGQEKMPCGRPPSFSQSLQVSALAFSGVNLLLQGGDDDRTKSRPMRQCWWKWNKGPWTGSMARRTNSTSHTHKRESWRAHPFWDLRLNNSSVKSPSMPERNL